MEEDKITNTLGVGLKAKSERLPKNYSKRELFKSFKFKSKCKTLLYLILNSLIQA